MNTICTIEDCTRETELRSDYPTCAACAPRYHFPARLDCQCRTCETARDVAFAESLDWELAEVRDLLRLAVKAKTAGDDLGYDVQRDAARREQERQYQESIDMDRWLCDSDPEPDESEDWRGALTL